MMLPIDTLYEISFNLIYQLRIQPSEVNNLTVPESRAYIRFYDDLKKRELEALNAAKESRSNNPKKVPSKRFVRHSKRR